MPDGELTNKRAFIYVGVVVTCFASIYPFVFHPLVKRALGRTEPEQNDKPPSLEDMRSRLPDELKDPSHQPPSGFGGPRAGGPPMHPHMGRPHPGSFKEDAAKTGGSSGGRMGMMGLILPVYSVGVIGYLVYTLFKVFGKSKGKNDKQGEITPDPTDPIDIVRTRLAQLDLQKIIETGEDTGLQELTELANLLQKERGEHAEAPPARVSKDVWRHGNTNCEDITLDGVEPLEADVREEVGLSRKGETTAQDQGQQVKGQNAQGQQKGQGQHKGQGQQKGVDGQRNLRQRKGKKEGQIREPDTELSTKASGGSSSLSEEESKMAALQDRLADTEREMQQIMAAMQTFRESAAALDTDGMNEENSENGSNDEWDDNEEDLDEEADDNLVNDKLGDEWEDGSESENASYCGNDVSDDDDDDNSVVRDVDCNGADNDNTGEDLIGHEDVHKENSQSGRVN